MPGHRCQEGGEAISDYRYYVKRLCTGIRAIFDGTYLKKICTGILTVGGTYGQSPHSNTASNKCIQQLTIILELNEP